MCGAREEPAASSRWEPAIARFEEEDFQRAPAKGGIVFVGSSSIRLWNLEESFPGLPVINRGFGGSQIADAAEFVPRIVTKYEPRLIVFYAGDNDLAKGKTPEQICDDFQRFITNVRNDLPEAKIIFLSIKPSLARWKLIDKQRQANWLIEAMIGKYPGVKYLDVATPLLGACLKPQAEFYVRDGLHLSPAGYRVWNELVRPQLD